MASSPHEVAPSAGTPAASHEPHEPHEPRVSAGGLAELGFVNWVLCKLLSRGAGVPEAHLFTTLGRQRSLFRAWLMFSARLMPGGKLSRQDTEMVILRVAHLRECVYERDHHVRLGRKVGIGPELLAAIERGVELGENADATNAGFKPRQRVLLVAVDELLSHKDLSDATWGELSKHYSSVQLIELCLLVGQYEMLATTINTLRIRRDF